MRLRRWHERWIYAGGAALWLSGLAWLIGHYALSSEGLPAPSEAWWMRVHGAAVMLFLVLFGALLPHHLLPGWRQTRNRQSGLLMLGAVALLVLSGWGLYYVASDAVRTVLSMTHWIIGLLGGGILVAHAVLGKRSGRIAEGSRGAVRERA